jgi:tRNA pseudouridine55 synthase
MMTDSDKLYEVEVLFGSETDTQDASGVVTAEGALEAGEDEVLKASAAFVGEYRQVPPMYSALKVKGRKLYELARKGVEIEREPRPVTIYGLEVLEMSLPASARLRVRCSKGTYMRTLCEDLGRRLNARAHMGRLIRLEAGGFSLNDAISMEKIREYAGLGRLEELIMPVEDIAAVKVMRKVRAVPEAAKRLVNGGVLRASDFESPAEVGEGEPFLVYTPENEPAALYMLIGDVYKPQVML